MNKIKPCPFCGGKAYLDYIPPDPFKLDYSRTGWIVRCLNNECAIKIHWSEDDAIEAWNTRSEQKCQKE